MQVHTLPKTTGKSLRRLGQGHGSGRGKTAGRGTKGQKARRDIALSFEGGALRLIKRLPFLRGKNKNKSLKRTPVLVSLEKLNSLPKNTTVTLESLIKNKLVNEKIATRDGVKILGNEKVVIPLTVSLPVSKQAAEQIKKAGGTVVL